ncbi:MAG: (d)CMP kinase [Clostridia bacterium]|nr:(d)CMP kinase [Clostridia bacterium]
MNKHFTIAIDGPAGAGKSTVAKAVAKTLGAIYLDTGAMYRAVGLYMVRNGVDPKDSETVAARAHEPKVDIRYVDGTQHVYLCGEDVSQAIRENEVSAAASGVSAVPLVREILVARQQEIAREQPVVMDGRDIGTKVLPDATLKIFLTAAAEERARRRYDELTAKGQTVSFDQLLKEINQRDWDDSHRAASPLTQAEDAVLVDSSHMTIEEVTEYILSLARERMDNA